MAEGLECACADERVAAGLAHAAALDDAVARLVLVLHSNDARARTATLRVLGAMAPLVGPRLTVRHTVVRSAVVAALALQAAHALGDDALPRCPPAVELAAALRAAARLAARAPPFARVLLPVLRALLVSEPPASEPALLSLQPVAAVRPRCACVAALAAMWRDPALAAAALALCRALVLSSVEATAVRCCAARTATELGCRSAVGVAPALAALRDALTAAPAPPARLVVCLCECIGALSREQLVPAADDARLLCAVASNAHSSVIAREAALAAFPVFAVVPHNAELADAIAQALTACTAAAPVRHTSPALATAALNHLAAFVTTAEMPVVAAAYHRIALDIAADDDAVTLLHSFPPEVFWARVFEPAWRQELVAAAVAKAPTGGAAFLRRCALVARSTEGGRTELHELLAPHVAHLVETASSTADSAADAAAALVVGGAADEHIDALLTMAQPWAVYRVLRVAFGEGRATLCLRMLPRLTSTATFATPFRAWLHVLTLVARAEYLVATSRNDSDDLEEDETVRMQRAVALLLRAVGVLEARVAPRAPCSAQTTLLRLRAAALAARAGADESALRDIARRYVRLGAQPRLSAHSRAVLAATAQHCRDGMLAPKCGLWYPPSFFVLHDCDCDNDEDGNENEDEDEDKM